MKVMIIPEDFKNDQYILKPLFSRLFRNIGIPSVEILICQNPRLRGVAEALNTDRLTQIIERYGGMMDAFVLCVDRDGVMGRRDSLDRIEQEFGNNRISSPRTPGKKLRPGCWPGWICPATGDGRMFAQRLMSRKDTLSRFPRNAV